MIINYQESLVADAMGKTHNAGIADVFDGNVVMIKRDFVVNEYSLLKAGTIGYMEWSKTYDINYGKKFTTFSICLSTPNKKIVFHCYIPDKTNIVMVSGLKENIELNDLLEVCEGDIAFTMKEYCKLQEKYDNLYRTKTYRVETATPICFCVMFAMFVSGGMGFIFARNVGLTSFVQIAIVATFLAFTLIAGVFGLILNCYSFDKTKKGKALKDEIKYLEKEIQKTDKALCEQFANKLQLKRRNDQEVQNGVDTSD